MKIKKPFLRLQMVITLLVCVVVALSLVVTDTLIGWKIGIYTKDNIAEKATYISRIVAKSPIIIEALTGKRDESEIQTYTNNIMKVTGTEYVVVIDMNGIRKSHPDISRIGKHFVGGDDVKALRGHEYISTAKGTLGVSLRAFTPIYSYENKQIGAIAVGILMNDVQDALDQSRIIIYIAGIFGLLVGVVGAMLLAKRIKKTLFGLEPSQIATLLEERNAILQSVREGILAVDNDCKITLVNSEALRLFKLAGINGNPIGENVEDYISNTGMTKVLDTGVVELDREHKLNGLVLLTNRVPIYVNGKVIGAVATFRDKTEIKELAEQLTGVKLYAEALRAQTHEFMNKLHVILGMVHMQYYDKLVSYISKISNEYQAEVGFVVRHIKDPVIAGFLLGKMSYAREKSANLILSEECYLPELNDFKITNELVTILGNLVDNALDAVKNVAEKNINVYIEYDDELLTLKVDDTGIGMTSEIMDNIFTKGYSTKGNNRGLGLFFVKESVKSLGGDMNFSSEINKGTKFTIYLPCKSKGDVK